MSQLNCRSRLDKKETFGCLKCSTLAGHIQIYHNATQCRLNLTRKSSVLRQRCDLLFLKVQRDGEIFTHITTLFIFIFISKIYLFAVTSIFIFIFQGQNHDGITVRAGLLCVFNLHSKHKQCYAKYISKLCLFIFMLDLYLYLFSSFQARNTMQLRPCGLLYVLLRCAIYIYEQRVQTVINVALVHATRCNSVNQL